MPTRFCVKKTGKPSSINISIDIIKKSGIKIMHKRHAKILLIIIY
jgi:hypothetical protein